VKLVEFNWKPTDRQLKEFGLAALVLLPLAGWLATGRPRTLEAANIRVIGGLAAAGLSLTLLSFAMPKAIKPVFIGTSLVTWPIGMVVGEAATLIVFYALFAPIGLIFRLVGRDVLERRLDPKAKTYWQLKRRPADVRSYYRQF